MNRFQKEKRTAAGLRSFGVPVLLFAVIFSGFAVGIRSVSDNTREKQLESLRMAVHRDMVQCYAMEGRYPESLEYMEQHYGLLYDKETYFIDYEITGSNLMPDVTVIEK
ncbi:MAG: hypothetical protein Q4B57_07615 [Eubacteriales bacterium]|nr:hypothetical protein [Eubacteriales bacterium]